MHVHSRKSDRSASDAVKDDQAVGGREGGDIFSVHLRDRQETVRETCPNASGLRTGGPTAKGSPPPLALSSDQKWVRLST